MHPSHLVYESITNLRLQWNSICSYGTQKAWRQMHEWLDVLPYPELSGLSIADVLDDSNLDFYFRRLDSESHAWETSICLQCWNKYIVDVSIHDWVFLRRQFFLRQTALAVKKWISEHACSWILAPVSNESNFDLIFNLLHAGVNKEAEWYAVALRELKHILSSNLIVGDAHQWVWLVSQDIVSLYPMHDKVWVEEKVFSWFEDLNLYPGLTIDAWFQTLSKIPLTFQQDVVLSFIRLHPELLQRVAHYTDFNNPKWVDIWVFSNAELPFFDVLDWSYIRILRSTRLAYSDYPADARISMVWSCFEMLRAGGNNGANKLHALYS